MTTSSLFPPMNATAWRADASNDSKALFAQAPAPQVAPRRHDHRRGDFLFGRREVSSARREVLVDGQVRTLQPRPFDVLVYLIDHRDRVVSTDELLDHIWKDEVVQPGSLAAAIVRIRKALLDAGDAARSVIRTHQGIGYRFVAALDDEVPAGPAARDEPAACARRA